MKVHVKSGFRKRIPPSEILLLNDVVTVKLTLVETNATQYL